MTKKANANIALASVGFALLLAGCAAQKYSAPAAQMNVPQSATKLPAQTPQNQQTCTSEKGGVYKYRDNSGNVYFSGCELAPGRYTLEWYRPRRIPPQAQAPTSISLSKSQINAIRSSINSRLKDPYSSKFHTIRGAKKDKAVYACGMVNAKNAFGGYVGKRPFLGIFDGSRFVVGGLASSDFEALQLLRRCSERGIDL
ncbi:hypothetical protein [Thiorhodococcus fuscus]|uniref:DUF4124 domain-containing protein n=1 Tax=Thiorhodococcus fuscus TaxID=527200 RepID=A0ABW4Y7A7_9GAMM